MIADQPAARDLLSQEQVWRGRVFAINSDQVVVAAGEQPVERSYMDHPGAVGIVALRGPDGAEEVLLMQQYRHPVRSLLWEIPAGLTDVPGEERLATAQRELAEEVDMQAEEWHVLVDTYSTPGCSNEALRIFLARELSALPIEQRITRTAEERDLKPEWIILADAVAAVHAGRIHNPATVVGLLAAASARTQGWQVLRSAK